ncbi:MAG: DUF4197 domain-containing protein [Cytophagales bacterium]|nr:DUF4197 domain-containing protein [Cytophagales bacterium]
MNRAAEESAALDSTKSIFYDAITDMSIVDGFNILKGTDTAATSYLKINTYTRLQSNFSGIISPILSKPLLSGSTLSSESLYKSLVDNYNSAVNIYNLSNILVPSVSPLQTVNHKSLANHATAKALDGLFLKIGDQEKKYASTHWPVSPRYSKKYSAAWMAPSNRIFWYFLKKSISSFQQSYSTDPAQAGFLFIFGSGNEPFYRSQCLIHRKQRKGAGKENCKKERHLVCNSLE